MLTDIAIAHEYKGKRSVAPLGFIMHPARNRMGPNAGKFEIINRRAGGDGRKKRSAHVALTELAELYARGLIETYRIALRVAPGGGEVYPDAHPGKYVPAVCIVGHSDFARMVKRVDRSAPMSNGVKLALKQIDIID